jgi:hypothetical protein
MTEPLKLLRSLDEIATSHAVFEKDQVLTEGQLNELARYFDDQDRLTRVNLLGVGIACGLQVALRDEGVVVGKGAGITTDGDLLRLPADLRFDRFKPYDRTAPAYAPFYEGGDPANAMLPVFELVPAGVEDSRARALGELTGFDTLVAVLLMESHLHDPDLCTATGCDNEGRAAIHTPRVLLVGADALAALEALPALAPAVPELDEVVAARALLPAGTATAGQLEAAYRTACQKTQDALRPALNGFYAACAGLLGDLFPADPGPGWVAKLQALAATQPAFGIQYCHDFFLDVVETWNKLRELVLDSAATVCCPDVNAFPKHLLLGRLARPGEHRTGFYPSPPVSGAADRLAHARFLALKLEALIELFDPPTGPRALRITPSRRGDRSLEERSIPFYYKLPIQRRWSFDLERRGEAGRNYSYLAADAAYQARGAAKNPLEAPLRGFDFFLVEGQHGKDVKEALAELENQVRQKHLPFRVRAVLLDADRTKIAIKPEVRWSDLHRLHRLVRSDLAHQLNDATAFSGAFQQQVNEAIALNVITNHSEGTQGPVQEIARLNAGKVAAHAENAATILLQPYATYVQTPNWKLAVDQAMEAAGDLKLELGNVVKTELATPVDTLIAGNQVFWLSGLSELIESKDEKEDAKLMFGNFLRRHPGLEHRGGVVRGGTLVLVYRADGRVVADFMLDEACCEEVETEIDEPVLPGIAKPANVRNDGLTLQPWRQRFVFDTVGAVETKLGGAINIALAGFEGKVEAAKTLFEGKVNQTWTSFDTRIGGFQEKFLETVGQSINLGREASGGGRDPGGHGPFSDISLQFQWQDLRFRIDRIDNLRKEILRPGLEPQHRTSLETQLRDTEVEVAKAAIDTTRYVVDLHLDVKSGSEGLRALGEVSEGISRLSNKEALVLVESGLKGARDRAVGEPLKDLIGGMLRSKGFPI